MPLRTIHISEFACVNNFHTVWKFKRIFLPLIVREYNFGKFWGPKIAISTVLNLVNFDFKKNFSLEKLQKFNNSVLERLKMANSETKKPHGKSKVVRKFSFFHTVVQVRKYGNLPNFVWEWISCFSTLWYNILNNQLTWSFLKKYKQESARKTKNRRLHFETNAEAHPGVVVGIIERLSFHKYPEMRIRRESSKRAKAKFMGSILRICSVERSWTLASPSSSSSQPEKKAKKRLNFCTVWKFQKFSVTQISREIKIRET